MVATGSHLFLLRLAAMALGMSPVWGLAGRRRRPPRAYVPAGVVAIFAASDLLLRMPGLGSVLPLRRGGARWMGGRVLPAADAVLPAPPDRDPPYGGAPNEGPRRGVPAIPAH